jgi:hypothetical protein
MEQLFDNLAWYLGCGLFKCDGWVLFARDNDFSNVELEFAQRLLEGRNVEYEMDNQKIRIKNDKSN